MNKITEELKKLELKKQLRTIPNIISKEDGYITIDGKKYVNFASNDYLGLSTKTELRKEFLSENNSLLSSASARLLTGSSPEYKQLENTVAEIFNKESALIFNTGYQANLGIISSLITKGDAVFSDKLNHASIIDGMQLSRGEFFRFNHCDYEHLERMLKEKREKYETVLIVSESVFSMDGDIADIDKLIELKNKYDCLLMIDEAHAFCTVGDMLAGITSGKSVDIITATFGKAVGSFGAFCVSNKEIISYLVNKARSFIFSTSIPPINIAWSNWILNEKREFVINQKEKLQNLAKQCHKLLDRNGIKIISKTQIIPLIVGDNEKTVKFSEELRAKGYYIPAIRPPTVPEGTSRLRISLTSDCSLKDFEEVINNYSSIL